MRQFGIGIHKTAGGAKAIVSKLSQVGVDWALKGAVECPLTGVYVLTYWSLSGVSLGVNHASFNLEESKQAS